MFVTHVNVILIAPIGAVMIIVVGACVNKMQTTNTTARGIVKRRLY